MHLRNRAPATFIFAEAIAQAMGKQEGRRNRRAQTLRLLVYLFVALMVIPLIMIFRNIFDFEGKASRMTDAVKTAELFKKDHLLAIYAPASNLTICHDIPNLDPCKVILTTPATQVQHAVDKEMPKKYAPYISVVVDDPPWNATVYLDVTIYGHYGALGINNIDVVEPRINAQNCWFENTGGLDYKRCFLNCTEPVMIQKIRHPGAGIGDNPPVMIDNVSIIQGAGIC